MSQEKVFNHLMVDIETLGTAPNACITSIAAVPFNLATGETGTPFFEQISFESYYLNKLNLTTMKKNVDYVVIPELPTHQQKEFDAWLIGQGRPAVSEEGENKFKCAYLSNYLAWRLTVAGESTAIAMKHLKQEPQEKKGIVGTWEVGFHNNQKCYTLTNGNYTFFAGKNRFIAMDTAEFLNKNIILKLGYKEDFFLDGDTLCTNLVGVFNSGENGEQMLIRNCKGDFTPTYTGKDKNITEIQQIEVFVDYEVNACWWSKYISWNWLQDMVGSYFARKVQRKYGRYSRAKNGKFVR